jgi:lipid II:glycine glycyltransferase (peptidoglycan interpeptide bridge formation enzyme)
MAETFSTVNVCVKRDLLLSRVFDEKLNALEDKEWALDFEGSVRHYRLKSGCVYHKIHDNFFQYGKKIYKEAKTVGGILSKNTQAFELLLDEYTKVSNESAGSTYITNPLQENVQELSHDILDKRVGQWTSLNYVDNIEENIMNSFESSARRNVRKAIKENVIVEIDNSQIDFLYETHYENITSIGGKAKDKKFFELIDKHFVEEQDYNIYIAKLNGEKIGALLLFYYNETVEYFTPAAVSEYRNVQALPLIIYQAMCEANQKGFKWWNWGGTWLTQDGVYKFKNKFGAVDKEYKYFIKINNEDIYNSSKEELLNEYDNFYVIPFDKLKG